MKYRAKTDIIVFLILLIITLLGVIKNESNSFVNNDLNEKVAANEELNEISIFIDSNYELFEFYSNTFGINMKDIEENLIKDNKDNEFNRYDINNSGKDYKSLDINIIDYLFNLEKENPNIFDKKITPNKESKNYIYNLIKYYSDIYGVDHKLLSSIAYIESGNLKAKGMMSKNNIFGGMNGNKLISYRNISYGVLSFVKLMKEKYYDNGLKTVDKICLRYNPIEVDGKKEINTKWINNVNYVLSKYDKLIGIYDI